MSGSKSYPCAGGFFCSAFLTTQRITNQLTAIKTGQLRNHTIEDRYIGSRFYQYTCVSLSISPASIFLLLMADHAR
jgi:hypothetical protein